MQKVETTLGANTLTIESGRVAKQANGSALVRYGDTVVLATACSTNPREGIDFFPSRWTIENIPMPREKFPAASSSVKEDPRKKRFSPAA